MSNTASNSTLSSADPDPDTSQDGRASAISGSDGAASPVGPDGEMPAAVSGTTEVRLARSDAEIEAAQALRYRVFYEERSAVPSDEMARLRRDFDRYDGVADHLLVLDRSRGDGADAVVGTYRLLRRDHASQLGGFYSASEYDIDRLVAYDGEVLELGRSCVDQDFRNRATMQLLWRGIATYVFQFNIGLMFGCASLPGNDVDAIGEQLGYLYHNHLAPEPLRAIALPHLRQPMDRLPPDQIDVKRALAALPPLIKGYLRLGGYVGDGAVVDPQFNTTDVCVIVKTDAVTDKYFRHYEREARSA